MEKARVFIAGHAEAKQQRAQSTIDQVLQATCALLNEHGEGRVRVQEISASTGVSIGSIYHHFGNREGLILAAYVESYTVELRRNLEDLLIWLDSIETLSDLTEKTDNIRNLANTQFAGASAMDQISILGSTVGRPKLKEALTRVQTELINNFAKSVARLQDLGLVKNNIGARTIAVMTLGIILGRAVADLDEQPLDSDDWNQVLLELLSGLLPFELLASLLPPELLARA